jgi:sodium-coupled neutral amino acid transporter 9
MTNIITLYHVMPSPVLCPEDEATTSDAPNTTHYSDSSQLMYTKVWGLTTTVPIFIIVIIGPLINFRSVTFFTKFNSLGK